VKWVGWWGKVFLAGFDGGGWEKGGGGGVGIHGVLLRGLQLVGGWKS